ncbi:phosphinothricin acetyltransferase [Polaromonas sp. YR568]|nr:phosphinothricin acetyltransferase [Polaromonas sp. YR568]
MALGNHQGMQVSNTLCSPGTAVSIHPCSEGDIAAIQAIYAHYVATNLATFELEPPTAHQMLSRRADILRGGYPYLVARLGGEVVGYAYASAYRLRPAYRHTVEDSIYVSPGHRQAGIGSALLRALIEDCEALGFRQMVGVVGNSANTGSLRVHEALGFTRVGTLAAVGYKFGQWVDTVLMQRTLGEGASTPAGLAVAQSAG